MRILITATTIAIAGCMPTDIDYTNSDSDCERLTGNDYIIDSKAKAKDLSLKSYCIENRLTIKGDFVDLSAFSDLREVGELHIVDAKRLKSFEGLSRVRVKKEIILEGNEALEEVTDSQIEIDRQISGNIIIKSNPVLSDLSGFRNVEDVKGDFQYTRNGGLKNLSDFEGLTQLEGSFVVRDNSSLTRIGGFADLTGTGDDLIISGNKALIKVDGFSLNLGIIGRNLTVTNNASLADTTPLSIYLDSVGGAIIVTGNTALSDCRADEFEDIPGMSPLDIADNSGVWEPCYE